MLMDLLVNFVLLGVYGVAVSAMMWVLYKIPFVRKTVKRCWRWFERVDERIHEATGYYNTWRQ